MTFGLDTKPHVAYLAQRTIPPDYRKRAGIEFLSAADTRRLTGINSPSIGTPFPGLRTVSPTERGAIASSIRQRRRTGASSRNRRAHPSSPTTHRSPGAADGQRSRKTQAYSS